MEDKKIQLSEEMLKRAAEAYVERRGEQLEKEAMELNRDDSNRPTRGQKRKFQKICRREFRKRNRTSTPFYKVAVAVAVFLFVFNISVVTVPALRSIALNFLTSVKTTHTVIQTSDEPDADREHDLYDDIYQITFDNEYRMTYVPEGYRLMEKKYTRAEIVYNYYDEENHYITYSQCIDSFVVNMDTEDAMVTQVTINGHQAVMTQEVDKNAIKWRVDGYFIDISADGLTREELLQIAESVEKIK